MLKTCKLMKSPFANPNGILLSAQLFKSTRGCHPPVFTAGGVTDFLNRHTPWACLLWKCQNKTTPKIFPQTGQTSLSLNSWKIECIIFPKYFQVYPGNDYVFWSSSCLRKTATDADGITKNKLWLKPNLYWISHTNIVHPFQDALALVKKNEEWISLKTRRQFTIYLQVYTFSFGGQYAFEA